MVCLASKLGWGGRTEYISIEAEKYCVRSTQTLNITTRIIIDKNNNTMNHHFFLFFSLKMYLLITPSFNPRSISQATKPGYPGPAPRRHQRHATFKSGASRSQAATIPHHKIPRPAKKKHRIYTTRPQQCLPSRRPRGYQTW